MIGDQHTLQSATVERVSSRCSPTDPEDEAMDEAVRCSALQALATLPTTELASPELEGVDRDRRVSSVRFGRV